jgi:hypothetical protein
MALQYPKSNADLTADPGIQLPDLKAPETVESNMRVRLYNCAIFPNEIDEIIVEAKARTEGTGLRWASKLADYPSMLSATAWIGVKKTAIEIMTKKNPQAMSLQILKSM